MEAADLVVLNAKVITVACSRVDKAREKTSLAYNYEEITYVRNSNY